MTTFRTAMDWVRAGRRGLQIALVTTVLAPAAATLGLATATPAQAVASNCSYWISGSNGQTNNMKCTSGSGRYYATALCAKKNWLGQTEYWRTTGSTVSVGSVSSAICYGGWVYEGGGHVIY